MEDDTIKLLKRILESYKDVSRRIVQLEAEIKQTRAANMSPSAALMTGMPRSGAIHDLSEYAARQDELLRELRKQYNTALERKKLTVQLIDELSSESEKLILWYRYIELDKDGGMMRLEDIADKTEYSFSGVRYIIDSGLGHLAKKWERISWKYEKLLPDSEDEV